jgi:hypothetical protein
MDDEYQIVPVNVGVMRYYRVYLRTPVDADLTDEEINKAVKQMIVTDNSELDGAEDPDLDIEEHDITVCGIDRDGIFSE